jgi:hypothetical protein
MARITRRMRMMTERDGTMMGMTTMADAQRAG